MEKAFTPIPLALGKLADVRFEQPEKVLASIEVALGMLAVTKLVQP